MKFLFLLPWNPLPLSEKKDVPPTILMIELDDDTRSRLKYNLGNWGYRVIEALEEEDAIVLSSF